MYYVIQVETGKENKTIQEMNERIPIDFKYEAFTPKFEELKKYKGEWKKMVHPYFPGYIFVETDNPMELFRSLLFVPSFTRLLGKSQIADDFIPLSDEEERVLDILCDKHTDRVTKLSSVMVKEGNKIVVLDGPLKRVESYVKKVNLHKRTVMIPISIGGISSDVEVGIDIISVKNSSK